MKKKTYRPYEPKQILDSTKIKANASKHKAMSYGRMVTEAERLESEIRTMLHKAATVDNLEDRKYGDRRGDELPDELADRQARLAKIRAAKAALEAEARRRDGIETNPDDTPGPDDNPPGGGSAGRRRRKREPGVPEARAQRNFTDPNSRIMKGSDKQFLQAYNAQAAVDSTSQVIVAATVTNQAADAPHLVPVVTLVEENVANPKKYRLMQGSSVKATSDGSWRSVLTPTSRQTSSAIVTVAVPNRPGAQGPRTLRYGTE